MRQFLANSLFEIASGLVRARGLKLQFDIGTH